MKAGGADQRSQDALFEGYEALLDRSRLMLGFARRGAWPALIDEETLYMVEVERLGALERAVVLDAAARERRAALLEGILENSLEIKRHLARRHAELVLLSSEDDGGAEAPEQGEECRREQPSGKKPR